MMAEKLRKRLLTALRPIFKPKNYEEKQSDFSPFEVNMKRLACKWLNSMYTTILLPNLCLRVWDAALVYGFDSLIKFGLALLSLKEKNIIKNVKAKIISLDTGICVDSLIMAGNYSCKLIFSKPEKLDIEKMLKKAMTKPSYRSIQKADFFIAAQGLEINNNYRLTRLRQTKLFLKRADPDGLMLKKLSISIIKSEKREVTLEYFRSSCTKNTSLSKGVVLNLFNTIDDSGNEAFDKSYAGICISILLPISLKEKFKLCYCFQEHSISLEDFLKPVHLIERFLDPYSRVYTLENQVLVKQLTQDIGLSIITSSVPEILSRHCAFELLCMQIQLIDNKIERNNALRLADINLSGSYSDIHSPLEAIVKIHKSHRTTPLCCLKINSLKLLRKLTKIGKQIY